MKAIKFNTTLNTTFGVPVPKGAILVVAEVYLNRRAGKIVEISEGVTDVAYPAAIGFDVYASEAARQSGQGPIQGLTLGASVENAVIFQNDLATKNSEDLFIEAVLPAADKEYPGKVKIVEI